MTHRGRLLIRGGLVLTMDACLGNLERADVLVEGDRIAAVAAGVDAGDAPSIDAAGMIVLPGFVDAHRHVWQTQLRTVATDWSLFDYFSRMRSIYSSFYEPEDAYLGNYAGALEALNAGITTIVDHCHIINSPRHADEAVRGLSDAGIRGIFCYGLFPNPTQHPFRMEIRPTWRFDDARRVRREHFSAAGALLEFGIAPTEVEAMPFEDLAAEIAFARELGARRISCHVAMGAYDRGRRVVAQLAEAGLLRDDLLFVHGSALTEGELEAIREAGAAIVATPETELQMGMGHPVTARALERGVKIGLGVDIVSNYAGDMFAPMRLQLQVQRGLDNARLEAPPRAVRFKAREVLELATIGGARALGLATLVGSLVPGKQADIILIRTDAINMVPISDPIGAVVLNANIHDVDTVLVAGRPVKRSGALVGVDWAELSNRLRRSQRRIASGFDGVPRQEIEAMAAAFML